MRTDRQRGTLLGLAVGDALGAAVEFKSPDTFEPVTGYRAGGPHGLAPGEWTDDTSMALALAESEDHRALSDARLASAVFQKIVGRARRLKTVGDLFRVSQPLGFEDRHGRGKRGGRLPGNPIRRRLPTGLDRSIMPRMARSAST